MGIQSGYRLEISKEQLAAARGFTWGSKRVCRLICIQESRAGTTCKRRLVAATAVALSPPGLFLAAFLAPFPPHR